LVKLHRPRNNDNKSYMFLSLKKYEYYKTFPDNLFLCMGKGRFEFCCNFRNPKGSVAMFVGGTLVMNLMYFIPSSVYI
jgi:hypothetical protein